MKVSHGINVPANVELAGMFLRLFVGKDGYLYDREGADDLAFEVKVVGDRWMLVAKGTSSCRVAIQCDRDGLVNKPEVVNFLTEAFVWV